MIGEQFLYLSREDVAAAAVDPDAARAAVIASFRALAEGRCTSLPKQPLTIGPGHAFQAMVAASAGQNIAAVKWLGITALDHGAALARIQAVICLNDYATGALLAVMDGDRVTLIRTAAMSAAAAEFLAPRSPASIGFIGCGAQAQAYLAAFRALYPQLGAIHAFSRTHASAKALAAQAHAAGLQGVATRSPEDVVRQSDILVTSVPAAPGLAPFLDPGWLKPDAFVAAVDVGRSWLATNLDAFAVLATDSMSQADMLAGTDGNLAGRAFDCDPRRPRQRCRAAAWRPRVVQLQGVRDRRSRSGESGLRSGPD